MRTCRLVQQSMVSQRRLSVDLIGSEWTPSRHAQTRIQTAHRVHERIHTPAIERAFRVIAEHELPLSEIELHVALKQLGRSKGSITRAAQLLGVNRRTLQRKLKRGFERQRRKRRQRQR